MYQVAVCVLIALAALGLGGCLNPARQAAPVTADPPGADWQKELVPGRSTHQALAYLLTNGFDCRVTRDEKSQVERILATPSGPSAKRQPQIDITIAADKIQRVELVHRAVR